MTTRRLLPIASLAAVSLAASGTALAASAGTDTAITVSPRTTVASAPAKSPISFPGARDARAGKPLARGNVVVGRAVKFTRGSEVAYAGITVRCPAGKTLRSFGRVGGVAPQLLRPRDYVGRRQADLLVWFDARTVKVGQSVDGTVLALCH
jgi:hypothetical protein